MKILHRLLLELSWKCLTDAEQLSFSKLAVFQGGFTLEAAQEVAGLKLSGLKALQQKSLVEWDVGTERYGLHPLIRSYVESKTESNDF